MVILTDFDGKIITTADSYNETDAHYILNYCGFMKCDFIISEVSGTKENKTHFHNEKFSNYGIKESNEIQQNILSQLSELDKEVPRIIEDIIKTIGFKPYKDKQETISQKEKLRAELDAINAGTAGVKADGN
jgi:hypothetical protein